MMIEWGIADETIDSLINYGKLYVEGSEPMAVSYVISASSIFKDINISGSFSNNTLSYFISYFLANVIVSGSKRPFPPKTE